ncbi:MAG: glycosyltransferase, partial [Chloroflexi bacterium]|nr:glycosyltransferase [Chloroflexota bacterium]
MSKLRIYIAIATFDPLVGGAEMQAKAQGVALCKRGHDTTIVTFRHAKEWSSHELVSGLPVIRVAGKLLAERAKQPKSMQKLLYLLAQVVLGWTLWTQRHHYDVLHVYQLSLLALPTALVCLLARKPLIISVRSTGSGKL